MENMDFLRPVGTVHEILSLEEWLDLPKELVQLYSANDTRRRAIKSILPATRSNYMKLDSGAVASYQRDRISVFGSISADTEYFMVRLNEVSTLRLYGYISESNILLTNTSLVHAQTVIRSNELREFSLVKSNLIDLYNMLTARGKTLDLSDYGLKEIPKEVFVGKISKLLANNNRLADLASGFLSFAKLQRLSLSNNNFTEIPPILFQLTSLKNISFAYNKIKTLPSTVSKLVALRQLYLEGNELEKVPEELAALPELIILNVSDNKITSNAWPQLMKVSTLHRLVMSGNTVDSIPDNITVFTGLRILNLANNQIKSLPTSMTQMTSLRRLHLNNNELETIPQELAALRKLLVLELNNNKIAKVPPQFWTSLSKHTKVSLENNNMANNHSVKPKTSPGSKPVITKLNLPKDIQSDMGESAWDRTMRKASISEARPAFLTQMNISISPRSTSPRNLSPRHLSPLRSSSRRSSLELSPKSERELQEKTKEKEKDKEQEKTKKKDDKKDKKKEKEKEKPKDKDKEQEKERDKDKDKKKSKIKGLREQRGMLKSKSLEISPAEEKHKSKAQDLEDEKKKLKEFEKSMNHKSKITRKDSDSDSMPKSEFIRTNSNPSAASDQPGSPKSRSSKRMSVVIDMKALKKAEREKLSSSMSVADDSKVQTQKPSTSSRTPEIHVTDNTDPFVESRKRSTSANTALPLPAFTTLRRAPSLSLSQMEPIGEAGNRPDLTVTSPNGEKPRSPSHSSRLTRTESSVRLRTREEFKELLKESNSDLKQAVLPTSPKKNRRRSISMHTLAEKTFLDNLPESSTDYILDRTIEKTYLSACTIDKLIEFVTYERGRDKSLIGNFLVTFPYYLSGKELLTKLKKRFEDSFEMIFLPSPKDGVETVPTDESNAKYASALHESLFDLLKQVFNVHSLLVEDEGVREVLDEFSKVIVKHSKDEVSAAPLTLLFQSILSGSRTKYRSAISSQLKDEDLEGAPEPIIPANIDIDNLDILDIAPEEIARQMTLLDFDLFARIEMREWFDAPKNNPILTPNVNAFIKRFNEMSRWVSTIIVLTEAQDLRTLLINNFIIIALKCWELNNFSGVMEIISGLEAAPIQRLTNTWSSVPQKTVRKFEQLKEIMSITGNFRRVREMLLSTSPPCAPYIGVYLQDMVFIEDGNQTWTDEGLLNFDKISIFGKVLQQIRTFQQTPYRLFPIPFLQDFLTNKLIMLDDNTLEEESFKRELKAMSSPKQNKSK